MTRPAPTPWPQGHWPAPSSSTVPITTGLHRTAILLADGRPYLERFHLVDTDDVQVRYHHWLAGDPDRDLHDHPWDNVTCVLAGALNEVRADTTIPLDTGTVVARRADEPHRIELVTADAWTLFVAGPITRRWGFHTARGWVSWRTYTDAGRYQ